MMLNWFVKVAFARKNPQRDRLTDDDEETLFTFQPSTFPCSFSMISLAAPSSSSSSALNRLTISIYSGFQLRLKYGGRIDDHLSERVGKSILISKSLAQQQRWPDLLKAAERVAQILQLVNSARGDDAAAEEENSARPVSWAGPSFFFFSLFPRLMARHLSLHQLCGGGALQSFYIYYLSAVCR